MKTTREMLTLKSRAAYTKAAAELTCTYEAGEYALELACRLFGNQVQAGCAFLQRQELFTADPLKTAAAVYTDLKLAAPKLTAERIWHAQVKMCLPICEEERRCFITAEYGRLLPLLGVDYWNRETGTYGVLWKYDIGARIDEEAEDALCLQGAKINDPYDLELPALAMLGYLDKRIEMLGTVSYTPFFRMRPEDRERLVFLNEARERLLANQILAPDEMNKLCDSHITFMTRQ